MVNIWNANKVYMPLPIESQNSGTSWAAKSDLKKDSDLPYAQTTQL